MATKESSPFNVKSITKESVRQVPKITNYCLTRDSKMQCNAAKMLNNFTKIYKLWINSFGMLGNDADFTIKYNV